MPTRERTPSPEEEIAPEYAAMDHILSANKIIPDLDPELVPDKDLILDLLKTAAKLLEPSLPPHFNPAYHIESQELLGKLHDKLDSFFKPGQK